MPEISMRSAETELYHVLPWMGPLVITGYIIGIAAITWGLIKLYKSRRISA